MKKIKIIYFSGTGNTSYVVRHIAKELVKFGNKVEIVSCENTTTISDDFDVLGIAFPIYTSKAPIIFEGLLDNLPKVNNKPLFGIVTSGYMAGDVLHFYHQKLLSLGYAPLLYENFVVGNNLHLPYLSPLKVLSEDRAIKKREKLLVQVKEVSEKINENISSLKGSDIFSVMFGLSQRSLGKFHEHTNFKGFHVDESCIKCMWCVNNCPTYNISLVDGKIVFDDNCIICMRCYSFCPFESIQCTKHTKKSKYKRYKGIENMKQKTLFNGGTYE